MAPWPYHLKLSYFPGFNRTIKHHSNIKMSDPLGRLQGNSSIQRGPIEVTTNPRFNAIFFKGFTEIPASLIASYYPLSVYDPRADRLLVLLPSGVQKGSRKL